ncbi:MAG TPA: PhzF family phenazine biosynthesis protein [Thermoanaerobaculia bacterium]
MSMPLFHVDAFTDRPFAGNPAAVCLIPDGSAPDDAWHQNVAREMNLSETAFLRRRASGWDLRWFTPAAEVDLCGHATLASAHVLWETGYAPKGSTLDFETRSGRLSARSDAGGTIELDFPAETAATCAPVGAVLAALGIASPAYFGKNRMDYLVALGEEEDVRALRPDFAKLKDACGPLRGVIVTAKSRSPRYDFDSRYFAPAFGIDEDPVTGSAHCCLAPFWSERLGKPELTGFQASSRGGVVGVRLGGGRVALRGRAVSVSRGELL